MKNIIMGFFTIVVIGLMAYTASQGGAYHGGEHGKVIEDIGNKVAGEKIEKANDKDDREKEMDALNALREKAGSAAGFEVSNKYKSKCSSCHGINGSGFQYGKKLMGPKLIGQTEAKILDDLVEFKAGRKENIVMKGLLMSLNKSDLEELAKEIGDFERKSKEAPSSKKQENNKNKYDMSAW
ncbi:MAG: c-type cytochrome [Campylobacteraceae bacterium]|nr:c-type cytochrome [Campylobacteraceae bacterium]MBT3883030.1 c-type cytochrome [Campylobacteraceae bacterium]MBT4030690.1 c-type cytochrome [Campylobacteraceae bacterium]MBT4179359.1 c-type cytochrome [Campylobacteraceae bacterium]MBT4572661.1 c-type cytochrome [Campylobacteraceae bacterium]